MGPPAWLQDVGASGAHGRCKPVLQLRPEPATIHAFTETLPTDLALLLPGASSAVLAVCGAPVPVTLDGQPVNMWQSFAVKRGQVVKVGATAAGSRAYIAIAGGLDVPEYLGSKATFPGGTMGGHQGRALRPGDMLFLAPADLARLVVGAAVPPAWRPQFCSGASDWTVGVLPGVWWGWGDWQAGLRAGWVCQASVHAQVG